MEFLVYNLSKGREVARVRVAKSFFSRAIGLMLRRDMDKGLLIEFPEWQKRPRLHSFFMFFPIELVFVDERHEVVEKAVLRPWGVYKPVHESRYVLELEEGKNAELGDRLDFTALH